MSAKVGKKVTHCTRH